MTNKMIEDTDANIIETVDINGTYQEERREKEERRNYPTKSVLFERRITKDKRIKKSIDIKI
ncbi:MULTISPECIES: hypothetical protein [Aliivibrio]|uniref:Uncharacterized protein n=3 Tax=Aliivibrio TaxID=511678 RepID=A0A1B9P3K9_ALILO|nr:MULTISPECIES: hypothetical protein [Aliivibrio]AZL86878.1 hypothetical protein EIJ81_21505 [Aliivibrio salmonicida]MBB1313774.1 hypothetical protein [Aliivibrio sp. SR45-2]OCH23063.1 hypothetical protein A6E04_03945 [Aliivibrio logei]OEF22424.1 hypothetical protein A1Q5_15195 [Aliivibrio logei 5S-186]CAQ81547.1 hypothetical protein VSAL_II0793 [Aliivibrio salmonicida LFI1238]